MTNQESQSVKVVFVTRDETLQPEAPLPPVMVPTSLKRLGLSEIVNQLLDTETPVPLDFLIVKATAGDGGAAILDEESASSSSVLLRPGASLDSFLADNGLSSEVSLSIEYIRSVLPPSFLASFSNPDWVAAVDINAQWTGDLKPVIASGSYDGVVRLWDHSGHVTGQLVGHNSAAKAVRWISNDQLVSGGSDRLLYLWNPDGKKYRRKEPGQVGKKELNYDSEEDSDEEMLDEVPAASTVTPLAALHGHTAPINDLAVHAKSGKIISASADGSVGLWSTDYNDMPAIEPHTSAAGGLTSTSAQKRRKLANSGSGATGLGAARQRGPLAVMGGHSAAVSAVAFHHSDPTVAYSVSLDHTIKTWDLATAEAVQSNAGSPDPSVDTRSTSFSLLSLCTLPQGLIACGSSARHITLHDPRVTAQVATQAKLVGHTNFVSSLSRGPESNPFLLASGSHDGTVRIWDVRTTKSLHVIHRETLTENNAVFGVDWKQNLGIVSGGQDNKIQINNNPQSA